MRTIRILILLSILGTGRPPQLCSRSDRLSADVQGDVTDDYFGVKVPDPIDGWRTSTRRK
jgi:hypothetical protein